MKQEIIELRKQGKKIKEICDIFKIGKGTVGYYLKNQNIETLNKKHSEETKKLISESLKNRTKDWILLRKGITIDEFIKKSNNSLSRSKLSKELKLSYKTLIILQKEYNCENKCTVENRKILAKEGAKKRQINCWPILNGEKTIKTSYYSSIRGVIKRFLFSNNIKDKKCEVCCLYEWNGKPISLELEHIDGNNNNNILSNLKILCPNCHAQTDTYKGKNKKKKVV